MSIGEVFEVIDRQVLFGQEVLNVYFYKQIAAYVDTSSTTRSETLGKAFIAQLQPSVVACQHSTLTHTGIEVRSLWDLADGWDTSQSVIGGFAAAPQDDLPSFNAIGFELPSLGRAVRDGAKRIAGVIESGQVDGGLSDPTLIARCATAANKMAKVLTVGLDIPANGVWQPTIVKRIKEGVDPDFTYRLPENSGETVVADVVTAIFKYFLTSQISRKVLNI